MKYPRFFEQVEEKLGRSPGLAVEAEFSQDVRHATIALLDENDRRLPATWFDPSFDPTDEPAIPFSISFNDSVPSVSNVEAPKPLRAYVPVDSIAVYAPWHIYRDEYGAYIRQERLLGLARRIAVELDVDFSVIAPHVLRQVVRHEQMHFMFEVAAAELEDVCGRWLYHDYTTHSGPWPGLTDGVVEEIAASWREVTYAAGVESKFPVLRGYRQAVEQDLSGVGPGYRDFALMKNGAHEVRSAVASLILADSGPSATGRWGLHAGKEPENMPLHWVGDAETLGALGGRPRTVGQPSIRRFNKWLRKIGASIDPSGGKGSHAKAKLPNGAKVQYATSAGILLPPEASQIAQALGLRNARELYEMIRDMKVRF